MIPGIWREFTINPEAIVTVFGKIDPSLSNVRLTKVELSEDGPTLNLSLALNEYPAKPPVRWKREVNNAVLIQFQCMDLVGLSLKRLPGDSRVSCEISKGDSGPLQIRIIGSATEATIQCSFIRINHVTPYQKDCSLDAL
jgi:hypothetical protein